MPSKMYQRFWYKEIPFGNPGKPLERVNGYQQEADILAKLQLPHRGVAGVLVEQLYRPATQSG
jgi:hypothetical protein